MSDEAHELHRIIRASVRDMLDAYRLQTQAGPVSDQALEGIIFSAAHPVMDRLAPYPAAQRAALLPSLVRLLLASFLEDVAGADRTEESPGEGRWARHTSARLPTSGVTATDEGPPPGVRLGCPQGRPHVSHLPRAALRPRVARRARRVRSAAAAAPADLQRPATATEARPARSGA